MRSSKCADARCRSCMHILTQQCASVRTEAFQNAQCIRCSKNQLAVVLVVMVTAAAAAAKVVMFCFAEYAFATLASQYQSLSLKLSVYFSSLTHSLSHSLRSLSVLTISYSLPIHAPQASFPSCNLPVSSSMVSAFSHGLIPACPSFPTTLYRFSLQPSQSFRFYIFSYESSFLRTSAFSLTTGLAINNAPPALSSRDRRYW